MCNRTQCLKAPFQELNSWFHSDTNVFKWPLSWWSWPCHLSVILYPGFLRDRLGDYNVAFYLAGIPPLIGGAVLCVIPWVEARRKRKEAEATAETTEKMLEHKIGTQDDKDTKTEDPESVIWGTCGSFTAQRLTDVCVSECVFRGFMWFYIPAGTAIKQGFYVNVILELCIFQKVSYNIFVLNF